VGFLSDKRRLNVALTRAKRGLIILGKQSTLTSDDTWNEWFLWAEKNDLIKNHQKFENTSFQEVVVNETPAENVEEEDQQVEILKEEND
jgi:superfamily I DNA and/or RNA helicase